MENKDIFVFTTNIQNAEQAETLKVFDEVQEIIDWSIDLEDCDNILRVVGQGIKADNVIRTINERGFFCEELTCS